MDLIQYFAEHHDHLLYLIAAISFVIELSVMGLSGPLLFFAIACLVTGILVSLGVVNTIEVEVLSVGVFTAIIAGLLWKPLQLFQNSGGGKDTSSDMIGLEVLVSEDITQTSGFIRYSGINWTARIASSAPTTLISSGVFCRIVAVDGNMMLVEPVVKEGAGR